MINMSRTHKTKPYSKCDSCKNLIKCLIKNNKAVFFCGVNDTNPIYSTFKCNSYKKIKD